MNTKAYQQLSQFICSPYVAIVWFGLVVISYLYIDKSLTLIFEPYGTAPWLNYIEFITKFGESTYYLIGLSVTVILAHFILKNKTLTQHSLFFLMAIIIPGLVCNVLKFILGRARPIALFEHDLFGFYFFQFDASMRSFPSGHTTTITSIIVALFLFFPRYWMLYLGVLFTVATSRIILTAHYLSDVLLGMYLATLTVVLMLRLRSFSKSFVV
jgi:membrane-associated phospholipid phosphatase